MKKISHIFILLILMLSLNLFLTKRQYAVGNTYSANPGDNLQTKVNSLQPGDTLIFNDGTYNNSSFIVQNLHGTATAPITIKAANDGKAIIDGGGNTNYQAVVDVNNSSYIDIEGVVVRNGGHDVVGVFYSSNHVTLRRITAYNAGSGNNHVFDIAYAPVNNVLVEDCAGWGQGRYIFIAYHASNVTFRRDFGYQAYQTNFSPAPRSSFGVYGSSNVILENVIGTNTIPTQSDDNYYTGNWETSDDPTNFPTDNTQYLGDMFFNDCEGIAMTTVGQATNTTYKNVYFDIPYNTSCNTYNPNNYQPEAIAWGTNGGGTISNVTFANNNFAFSRETSAVISLTNSVFLNNTTAFQSDPGHSYSDFWNNGSLGTTLAATDKQVNPGYDTTTYGRGAYLFVPPTSPLKGTGANAQDIGANILYEYVNGQLTTTPLWPWPMESRIMAEKGVSVTYAANGGIWKTLTGVYSTPTSTPSPTPTYLTGDINHSGCINILDFNAWLQAYQGHPVVGTFPDVNGDGVIDILDFNSWLTTLQSIYNTNPNDPRLCTN